MVPRIPTILPCLTGEGATRLHPDAMRALCREIGDPAWRDRMLTPGTTLQRVRLQRLHGTTACRPRPVLGEGAGGSLPDTPA